MHRLLRSWLRDWYQGRWRAPGSPTAASSSRRSRVRRQRRGSTVSTLATEVCWATSNCRSSWAHQQVMREVMSPMSDTKNGRRLGREVLGERLALMPADTPNRSSLHQAWTPIPLAAGPGRSAPGRASCEFCSDAVAGHADLGMNECTMRSRARHPRQATCRSRSSASAGSPAAPVLGHGPPDRHPPWTGPRTAFGAVERGWSRHLGLSRIRPSMQPLSSVGRTPSTSIRRSCPRKRNMSAGVVVDVGAGPGAEGSLGPRRHCSILDGDEQHRTQADADQRGDQHGHTVIPMTLRASARIVVVSRGTTPRMNERDHIRIGERVRLLGAAGTMSGPLAQHTRELDHEGRRRPELTA